MLPRKVSAVLLVVFLVGVTAQDIDGDNRPLPTELQDGSSDLWQQSHAYSDDDRDGCVNQDEHESYVWASLISGAHGILLPHSHETCYEYGASQEYNEREGGYSWDDQIIEQAGPRPPTRTGWEEPSPLPAGIGPWRQPLFHQQDGRTYVFDSVCLGETGYGKHCTTSTHGHRLSQATPLGLNMTADGYGWRYVEGLGPLTLPWAGPESIEDKDGDGFPRVHVCFGRAIITPGNLTPEYICDNGIITYGDQDDEDPNVPYNGNGLVQQIVRSYLDVDGDNFTNEEEVLAGSNPKDPTSTPETDDDGDGCNNEDEPSGTLSLGPLTTGAFDVVIPHATQCNGRPDHYGGSIADGIQFTGDGLLIFDPVCSHILSNRDNCKATSAYDQNNPRSGGPDPAKGWGWTHVDLEGGPETVSFLILCRAPSDEDGDLVPQVQMCQATYNTTTGDTTTGGVVGTYGDPDDSDPETPVDLEFITETVGLVVDLALGSIDLAYCAEGTPGEGELRALDADCDGYSNVAEHPANGGRSNPGHASSTPATDDNGDGCSNENSTNGLYFGSIANGAYGVMVVRDQCSNGSLSSFQVPCEGTTGVVVFVCDGDVYVWDPVCRQAFTGDYEACKGEYDSDTNPTGSNYDASGEEYSGTYLNDGYGWRKTGGVPALLPYTFDSVQVCEGGIQDLDGDGIPRITFCFNEHTVYPNGNVETEEGDVATSAGDSDDQDPEEPIPQNIGDFPAAVVAFIFNQTDELNEAPGTVLGLLASAATTANNLIMQQVDTVQNARRLIEGLQAAAVQASAALANATAEEAAEIQANYIGYVNQTLEGISVLNEEVYRVVRIFDFQNHGPILDCMVDNAQEHETGFVNAWAQYVETQTAADLDAALYQINPGLSILAYEQSLCINSVEGGAIFAGTVGPILNGTAAVLAGGVQDARHIQDFTTAEAIAYGEFLGSQIAALGPDVLDDFIKQYRVLVATLGAYAGDIARDAVANPLVAPQSEEEPVEPEKPVDFSFWLYILAGLAVLIALRRRA